MINELEQKLNESKELVGKLDRELDIMEDNRTSVPELCFTAVMSGIKALYLQNEVIVNYLQEIYKNQSEVKK